MIDSFSRGRSGSGSAEIRTPEARTDIVERRMSGIFLDITGASRHLRLDKQRSGRHASDQRREDVSLGS
jgi:hypothetical protein